MSNLTKLSSHPLVLGLVTAAGVALLPMVARAGCPCDANGNPIENNSNAYTGQSQSNSNAYTGPSESNLNNYSPSESNLSNYSPSESNSNAYAQGGDSTANNDNKVNASGGAANNRTQVTTGPVTTETGAAGGAGGSASTGAISNVASGGTGGAGGTGGTGTASALSGGNKTGNQTITIGGNKYTAYATAPAVFGGNLPDQFGALCVDENARQYGAIGLQVLGTGGSLSLGGNANTHTDQACMAEMQAHEEAMARITGMAQAQIAAIQANGSVAVTFVGADKVPCEAAAMVEANREGIPPQALMAACYAAAPSYPVHRVTHHRVAVRPQKSCKKVKECAPTN